MNDACAYVIFGATGNLATTKLLPALYHLDQAGRLRPGMRIICSGRRPFAAEEWLAQVRDAVTANIPVVSNDAALVWIPRIRNIPAPSSIHGRTIAAKLLHAAGRIR